MAQDQHLHCDESGFMLTIALGHSMWRSNENTSATIKEYSWYPEHVYIIIIHHLSQELTHWIWFDKINFIQEPWELHLRPNSWTNCGHKMSSIQKIIFGRFNKMMTSAQQWFPWPIFRALSSLRPSRGRLGKGIESPYWARQRWFTNPETPMEMSWNDVKVHRQQETQRRRTVFGRLKVTQNLSL